MARPARIEYEGAFYHVMNRGNYKENILLDDRDNLKFYEILGDIENRYGTVIYAFVLMSNHYHLLIETPFANLSRAMQRLNGDYTLYFSRWYQKLGHIKGEKVDGSIFYHYPCCPWHVQNLSFPIPFVKKIEPSVTLKLKISFIKGAS